MKKTTIQCEVCHGEGQFIWSCCGYNITFQVEAYNDTRCPNCAENCGTEKEPCEACDGTGQIEMQIKKPNY